MMKFIGMYHERLNSDDKATYYFTGKNPAWERDKPSGMKLCDYLYRKVEQFAIENGVHFVRANNVVLDFKKSGLSHDSVGYGDSYIIDPGGEIIARSRRHVEDFIFADIDTTKGPDKAWGLTKSAWSYHEFKPFLDEAMKEVKAG